MGTFHRRAGVISVGDELILGQTLDTNAKWVSEQLVSAGVVPVERATVPDDLRAQAGVFARLARVCDLLICTGGLGPTADDLTRAALGEAMGEELVSDGAALREISEWFASRSRTMPAMNAVQALRPRSARCLQNANGTAPGLYASMPRPDGLSCDVFCLPGPPGEMRPMFIRDVLPAIRAEPGRLVRTRSVHTFGIGESALAERLGNLMDRGRNPLVGTTASGGVVTCRIRYEGGGEPAVVDRALDELVGEVRRLGAPYVFGEGPETLASVVLGTLGARGETLGVIESCTAGMLGSLLGDVPGASRAFLGGLVTYANTLKEQLAGVARATLAEHGAVSAEAAREMAVGGLERLGVSHCLAITGVAGPDGGTPEKPVGTVWIARASVGATAEVRGFRMVGDRQGVRDWSAKSALMMLVLHLAGNDGVAMLRQTS